MLLKLFTLLLSLLIFVLLTVSANAGTVAHFQGEHERDRIMIVLGEDDHFLVQVYDGGYFLHRDGQGYWLEAGPGGPRTMTAQARAYQQLQRYPEGMMQVVGSTGEQTPQSTAFFPEESVEIAGYRGTRYINKAGWVPVVLTEDEALIPFGRAWRIFREASEMGEPESQRRDSNFLELLYNRGILTVWGKSLVRIEESDRFDDLLALPDDILTLEMVRAESSDETFADEENEASYNPILGGVHYRNALWTRHRDGTLARWAEAANEPVEQDIGGTVADFCVFERDLLAVVQRPQNTAMQLLALGDSGWTEVTNWQANEHNAFLALDCTGPEIVLLTAEEMIFPQLDRKVAIDIEALLPVGQISTLQHDGWLYAGSNSGEWGGGLRRFALSDGRAERIEDNDGSLCGGLLNTDCDPVTGLAPDPANNNCILAGVGLVHMMSSGNIVRVCDTEVRLAYQKPYTLERDWTWDADTVNETRYNTLPFFDIVEIQEGAVAVSVDGLYTFGPDNADPEFSAFADFRAWAENGIDWTGGDIILVSTTMNQTHSLSGASLLAVARRDLD